MAITYNPETADLGTLTKVDPASIIIDLNVRLDIRLDKSFVSSIRVNGFEQYPVGYQDEDGKTHVTIGQRRVSAALEIGWPVIPIVIKSRPDAEADRNEELRIIAQLAENEQRAPLHESEAAIARQQLALFGVSEDQIARKTNSSKALVTTSLKVARSEKALAAIDKHQLTLDQAALLIEFEGDDQATKELEETASTRPEQLEHVAQAQRSRLARQRDGQSIEDKARAEGWAVVYRTDQYSYGIPSGHERVESLWRADDKKQTRLTVDDVKDSPGRVVYIDTMGYGETAKVQWLIKDHKKHGFDSYSYSSGAAKGPLTEDEKAARRQKRVDKAEMTDATIVRRAWISDTLLASKPALDTTIGWIAAASTGATIALGYDQAAQGTARDLAADLLGIERHGNDGRSTYDKALAEAHTTPERVRLLLAYSIALVEHVAGNQRHHQYAQNTALAPYFLQLQEWGYTLADVEQRIVTNAAKKGKK